MFLLVAFLLPFNLFARRDASTNKVPIGSPVGLRYLGYYAVYDASVLSHHGNLIFTGNAAGIERAAKFRIKAFHRVLGNLTSADDAHWAKALADWKAHADSIRPYITNVTAFYLYDEPYGQLGHLGRSVVHRRLARAAKAVKQTFPGVPVAIAEAADNMTNYYSREPFRVPPEIDWVGFNCYDGSFSDCGASHRSIPQYLAILKSALGSAQQRIFLIPPAFYLLSARAPESDLLSAIRHGGACTKPPNCTTQDSLAAIAASYASLARSDSSIVAIIPFTGGLHEDSDHVFLGALDMPRVRAAYDKIFASVPDNDVVPDAPFPRGTKIAAVGSTHLPTRAPRDTLWATLQILDDQNRPQLGVNIECTPSEDSRVWWRTRSTGTNDPTNAFFAWILGSRPRHRYTLRCQSPATGPQSVVFSATTASR